MSTTLVSLIRSAAAVRYDNDNDYDDDVINDDACLRG